MENIDSNLILLLAMKLTISEINKLCLTSSKFNQAICNNKYFWIARLRSDFGVNYEASYGDPKSLYISKKTERDEMIKSMITEYNNLIIIAKKLNKLKTHEYLILPGLHHVHITRKHIPIFFEKFKTGPYKHLLNKNQEQKLLDNIIMIGKDKNYIDMSKKIFSEIQNLL